MNHTRSLSTSISIASSLPNLLAAIPMPKAHVLDSETCGNPLCKNPLEVLPGSGRWRRTPKLFCSDQCKKDTWALKRAVTLLGPIGRVKGVIVLSDLAEGRF